MKYMYTVLCTQYMHRSYNFVQHISNICPTLLTYKMNQNVCNLKWLLV